MATEKLSSVFTRDFLDLCVYKLLICFYYIAFGPIIGFLALYFKQMGLNSVKVGLLIGIRTFLLTLGAPLAGLLADKYKIRKAMAVLALLFFFGQNLGTFLLKAPKETCMVTLLTNSTEHPTKTKTKFKDIFKKQTSKFESQAGIYRRGHHKQTFLPLKKQKITEDEIPHLHEDTATNHTATNARGKSSYIKQRLKKFRLSRRLQAFDEFEKRSQNQTSLKEYKIIWDNVEINRYFVYALLIIIIGQPLGGSLSALIDTGTVELLGENRNDIGKYRLWGAIGMGTSALLTGAVIQASPVYYYCEVLRKNYYLMFYIVLGFSFLTLFPLLLSKHVYSEETIEMKFKSEKYSKMKLLFCTIKNATFWMTVLCVAILDGFQADFGPWFLDDLGTSPAMIGIATTLHFACNAVAFMITPFIIDRFGHTCVLSLALFIIILLYILFSVAYSSWFGVALYSLVGIVPSLTWSCGISYVATIATPLGIVTTAEGIYHAIYTGVGISIGAFTGGIGIITLGIRLTFLILAGLSAFTLITMNVVLFLDEKFSAQDYSYEPVKTGEDEK